MKQLYILLLALLTGTSASAQTELTTSEAKSLYKTVSKKRQSVHDPSVVYEPNSKRYYIFGSHRAQAYTTDLQNWTWFTSRIVPRPIPQICKTGRGSRRPGR